MKKIWKFRLKGLKRNGRIVTQSKCSVFGIKNSRFMKAQEAKGLTSNLGIKTLLNKIQLLGDISF